MSLICKVIGHTPARGYGGDSPYFGVIPQTVDGMGVEHAILKATCQRCDQLFTIGKIHLPMRQVEKAASERAHRFARKVLDLEAELREIQSRIEKALQK